MSNHDGIFVQPLHPDAFRRCPQCLRWFALRLVRVEPSPVAERIHVDGCRFCEEETEFAESHPDGVL